METRLLVGEGSNGAWLERWLLLSLSLDKAHTGRLLEGLSGPQRARARSLHSELGRLGVADRHGRTAQVFARHRVSLASLEARLADAGAGVRAAVAERISSGGPAQPDGGTGRALERLAPLARSLVARLFEECRERPGS